MPASGSTPRSEASRTHVVDLSTSYGNFTIRPHRSLSDQGVSRLLLVIGVTGGLFDLAMFLNFGWIVGAITLMDVVFLGLAILLSQRQRNASETVVVLGSGVQVERHSASGRRLSGEWLPLFPISLRQSDAGSLPGFIELSCGPRHVRIGAALLPAERESLCLALLDSLDRAGAVVTRRGVTASSFIRARGLNASIQDQK